MSKKISFACDYLEGAHPEILKKLMETNMIQAQGYGLDEFSESAKKKIRQACDAPEADIFFLVGGTQTNEIVIYSLLKSYQGVISPETGHINTHEAGAIEFGGHKILTIKQQYGKVNYKDIKKYIQNYWDDSNKDHMVMPGMVYISQPTEYGTLYSLQELEEISSVCKEYKIPLFVDGARLAYALACPENNVSLKDLARLCDVFYIGGTKCGALFGEAVVIPKHNFIPHFFTLIKQQGALLAKGRINAIQFDTLFTDDLYFKLGKIAIDAAQKIKEALKNKGYEFDVPSPTNQIFIILNQSQLDKIQEFVTLGFWENLEDGRKVMRIATSWATTEENVKKLIELL